jgi:hypothetical protein
MISKIERCVWNAGTPEHLFVERHAICTLINRLQQKLKENNFPYKIKTKNGYQTTHQRLEIHLCAAHNKKINKVK